jgi:carbonic anhydrase
LTSELALERLIAGNKLYLNSSANPADISLGRRAESVEKRQLPTAAIVTCSDSRVIPEHIFSAGLGELFVIRVAGNIIGDFELGSIEFAVQQLDVPLVVVLGHSHCAAVATALSGQASGHLESVIHEIQAGLNGTNDMDQAILNNILHSQSRILQSPVVCDLVKTRGLMIATAKYETATGQVEFF